MGVPAFFRWLSMKYTQIVTHCIEEKPKSLPDNKSLPPDTSQPNPNSIEFDNLYLDMNGIIHPCTHPENKPAPKTESEMFHEIFLYIDRIFSVVRPRKLIYLAVDGVAPRAKMNQQRSRRFRAGKETREKRVTVERIRADLRQRGAILPAPKSAEEHFDSNCITPGTPFMARLAVALQYYVLARLEADAGWRGLQVVLSDASAPGEGEHKIMDFIRRQRASPSHDPNTRHCLCGADADLIMLGLATHEPYFTIIREEFKPNQPRPCDICGQMNHEMSECQGLPSAEFNTGASSAADKPAAAETEFIFIHLNVLREYLQQELVLADLTIPYDFERAIDDWVFMCFFVGNDFLPHLPSLEIREKAIDRLIEIYKRSMGKNNSWLTDSGRVNIERVQLIMCDLAMLEDEIFKSRRENELGNRQRNKERRNRYRPKRQKIDDKPFFNRFSEEFVKPSLGERFSTTSAAAFAESKRQALNTSLPIGNSRNSLAGNESQSMQSRKRRFSEIDQEDEEERLERELDKRDEVKLWEGGYRPRYYQSKFGVTVDENPEFCVNVAHQYLRGLCWVLAYYYQGCVDWTWYYPYHYAPFAEDFIDLSRANVEFEKDTKPFNPLEQLMGVFPADSRSHVPPSWQNLMTDSDSPVIDFYPIDFKIDLNGKRYEWQGVALLPFVDEARLLSVLEAHYDSLTDEEKRRNVIGPDRYFVRSDHPVADFINVLYESGDKADSVIDPQLTSGVSGRIWLDSLSYRPGSTVMSPIPAYCDDIKRVKVVSCFYKDPQYAKNFIFKAKLLSAVKMPDKTIGPNAIKQERKHFDTKPAARMINHSFGTQKIPQNFDFNSPNSQRDNSFNNPRNQQSPYNRQNNQYNQLNNQYSQQSSYNRNNNQYSPQNNQYNQQNQYNRPNNQYSPQNNQYNQYDSNNNTNESSYRRGAQARYSDPNVFGRTFQQLPNSNPLARTPNNRNSYSNQPNNRGQSNWNNSGNNWR